MEPVAAQAVPDPLADLARGEREDLPDPPALLVLMAQLESVVNLDLQASGESVGPSDRPVPWEVLADPVHRDPVELAVVRVRREALEKGEHQEAGEYVDLLDHQDPEDLQGPLETLDREDLLDLVVGYTQFLPIDNSGF